MRIEDSLARYGQIFQTGQTAQTTQSGSSAAAGQTSPKQSFESVFSKAMQSSQELTFSKHAQQRLIQRDIELSGEEMEKLNSAAGRAGEKGVSNTLILMDQKAFVVNVPNNVVITAMKGDELKQNIFTQIDGVVIV